MRYLIYIVLILAGCSAQGDPADQYIKSTSLNLCQEDFQLGSTVSESNLTGDHINKSDSSGMYVISCSEPGAIILGSGTDKSQIIQIKEASIDINTDSTIVFIEGVWYPEMEESPSNDIQKAQHEIEQILGQPATIRPLTWEKNGASLIIGSQEMDFGPMAFVNTKLNS